MERYGISFSEMNRKQKVAHIWAYYRYHILATCIAIIVIGYMGKAILFPPPADDVGVVICGPMYLDDTEDEVIKSYKEKYNVGLSMTSLSWDNDVEMANVMQQKLPMMITVGELEILAIPEEEFERYAKSYGTGMFMALDEIPELKDVLENYKDKLYSCDTKIDEDMNEVKAENHVYGIKVSKFANIPCITDMNEMVIGITGKLRDEEKALTMFKCLIGAEALPKESAAPSEKGEK